MLQECVRIMKNEITEFGFRGDRRLDLFVVGADVLVFLGKIPKNPALWRGDENRFL